MEPYKLVGTIMTAKGDSTVDHEVGEQIGVTALTEGKYATRRFLLSVPSFKT